MACLYFLTFVPRRICRFGVRGLGMDRQRRDGSFRHIISQYGAMEQFQTTLDFQFVPNPSPATLPSFCEPSPQKL